MAQIERVIADNLTYLTTVPQFFLGGMEEFNKLLDDQTDPTQPICLMNHIVRQNIDYGQAGNLLVVSDVSLLFLQGYPVDVQPELFEPPSIDLRRNVTINAMRVSAYEMISALDQDTRLDSQKQHRVKPRLTAMYNLFDSNLDGVELQLNLRFQERRRFCDSHSGPLIAMVGYVASGYVTAGYVANMMM